MAVGTSTNMEAHKSSVTLNQCDSDVLPVADDVSAKEGRQLHNGLIVLHGLALLNCKAHNLARLRRLRKRSRNRTRC